VGDQLGDQMSETQLYRHFDGQGELLYVGVSLSTVKRLGQHKNHSHWYDRIAKVEIQKFPTRKEALRAEREAVSSEQPLCNINLKKKPEEKSAFEEAEKARQRLRNRTVTFKPLYTVLEAASALAMSDAQVRDAIKSGELGAYEMSKTERLVGGVPRVAIRYKISGWHIIDYIEWLDAKRKK